MIGDLVTVYTGGWDKFMRAKCNNQAGIVTRIAVDPSHDYPMYYVNFGFAEVKVAAPRIRILTKNKE